MAVNIQLRRGLSTQWASSNPILAQGELVTELDTKRQKLGDGVNHYNDLDYTDQHMLDSLDEHVNSETPHPAYDDMPSLELLFENGLI
jgi:hypothetical protein